MNSKNKNWGNDVWLTSSLQDILIDVYPDFYEKCIVHVKENWRLCPDSLETCNMVLLQYTIDWPLNIIISSAQMAVYKDIFQFILKIKWGLYTLTHLYFTGKKFGIYVNIVRKEIDHIQTVISHYANSF